MPDKISRHIPSQPVYSAEMEEVMMMMMMIMMIMMTQVIEREEDRLRSAHSIDTAYKVFLSNNVRAHLVDEAWYNQVRHSYTCVHGTTR